MLLLVLASVYSP